MMTENSTLSLKEILLALVADATRYFDESQKSLIDAGWIEQRDEFWGTPSDKNYYWNVLPESLQLEAQGLVKRLLSFANQLAAIVKSSSLNSEADQRDLMLGTKSMRSALILRHFRHWNIEVLHDEGVVLGVQPANQTDDEPLPPVDAKRIFTQSADQVAEIAQLAEAGGELSAPSIVDVATLPNTSRYRPRTAFIMMWMGKEEPKLDDVNDAVKEVFAAFGIRAIRADDIEIEGLITQRVLDEISTAEFLFADLTGARPNVYYEVGYAHALGKHVILFRQTDTGIHFDLAGYNCPEYKNIHELKDKLRKRLESITNKKLSDNIEQ